MLTVSDGQPRDEMLDGSAVFVDKKNQSVCLIVSLVTVLVLRTQQMLLVCLSLDDVLLMQSDD